MTTEALPEFSVDTNNCKLANSKSFDEIIDMYLPTNPAFKLVPDASFLATLSTIWTPFLDESDFYESGKTLRKTISRTSDGLYTVHEAKNCHRQARTYLDASAPTSADSLQNMLSRNALTSLATLDDRTWAAIELKDSFLNYLDRNNVDFPSGLNFNKVKSPLLYDSKVVFEEPNAFTPMTVQAFDLPMANLLLPSSTPKIWTIVIAANQIAINDFLNHHRPVRCSSPLLHNNSLLDAERIESLQVNSWTTVQNPGEIIVLGPGMCYQTRSSGGGFFEEINVYQKSFILPSLERIKCDCYAVAKVHVDNNYDDTCLLTSTLEEINYCAMNGSNSRLNKFSFFEDLVDDPSQSIAATGIRGTQATTSPLTPEETREDRDDWGDAERDRQAQRLFSATGRLTKRSAGRLSVQAKRIKLPNVSSSPKKTKQMLEGKIRARKSYQNLPPEEKKKKAERDAGRSRNAKDEPAVFFQREIDKVQQKLLRIFKAIDRYNTSSSNQRQCGKPRRTLAELQTQQIEDEGTKESLVRDRDRYNILKQIYCRSRGALKANFDVGFQSDDIIRLFFNHTSRINRDIWNLAVEFAVKDEARQQFYKDLILDSDGWNDHFKVRHGFRIPWKEWATLCDPASTNETDVTEDSDSEAEQSVRLDPNESQDQTEGFQQPSSQVPEDNQWPAFRQFLIDPNNVEEEAYLADS